LENQAWLGSAAHLKSSTLNVANILSFQERMKRVFELKQSKRNFWRESNLMAFHFSIRVLFVFKLWLKN